MDYLEKLSAMAPEYFEYLHGHEVLNSYWEKLAVVLKGSTARGYSDKYSDLDFVIFTDKASFDSIVADYVSRGLSVRTDGVFLPLFEWNGHYNLDTFERLQYCFDNDDIINIWEYTNVKIMHDPSGIYQKIIENGQKLFKSHMDGLIRMQYLNIQLQLDWMRQPLRRADYGAAVLYGAAVWQACARLLYLLDGKAYPCDKWLFFYLDKLLVPDKITEMIKNYGNYFEKSLNFYPDRELIDYPMYNQACEIVTLLIDLLKEKYGDAQWIDKWYLYA